MSVTAGGRGHEIVVAQLSNDDDNDDADAGKNDVGWFARDRDSRAARLKRQLKARYSRASINYSRNQPSRGSLLINGGDGGTEEREL